MHGYIFSLCDLDNKFVERTKATKGRNIVEYIYIYIYICWKIKEHNYDLQGLLKVTEEDGFSVLVSHVNGSQLRLVPHKQLI